MDSESLRVDMNKLNFSISLILVAASLNTACYQDKDDDDNKTPNRKTPTATTTSSVSNNSTVNNSTINSPTPSNTDNTNMASNNSTEIKSGGFNANLPSGFVQPTDDVGRRIMREYGAVFVARGGVTPPPTAVFRDESAVSSFQSSVSKASELGIELQTAAMNKLKEAIAEAKQSNQKITPNGGAEAGRRSYAKTVELWASRVNPGLSHWVSKGKLQQSEANRIKALSPTDQIAEIFKLEEKGMFFAKTLDKTIMYSVAPPGTSQHLSMLALDVAENANPKVREILAKHGWFQTVVSDLPHFTFLGVKESELPSLGLKKKTDGGRTFWIPDV